MSITPKGLCYQQPQVDRCGASTPATSSPFTSKLRWIPTHKSVPNSAHRRDRRERAVRVDLSSQADDECVDRVVFGSSSSPYSRCASA